LQRIAKSRIYLKKRRQVFIPIEINRAEPARRFAQVHRHIDVLNREQRPIRLRFRRLNRPLDVRDQGLLRSPFAGNKQDIFTEQVFELLKNASQAFTFGRRHGRIAAWPAPIRPRDFLWLAPPW
jgi:hypothetical protein